MCFEFSNDYQLYIRILEWNHKDSDHPDYSRKAFFNFGDPVKALDFQNKFYTDEELAALVDTYLVVRAEDYFLSARPGSKVKILVKVGGIYVNSLKSKKQKVIIVLLNSMISIL